MILTLSLIRKPDCGLDVYEGILFSPRALAFFFLILWESED